MVCHPVTGMVMEWRELVSDPLTSADWIISMINEFDRMAQGVGKNIGGTQRTKVTDTIQSSQRKKRYICQESVHVQSRKSRTKLITIHSNG